MDGVDVVVANAGISVRGGALDITPESLAFYDIHMKCVVEPGEFEIMVGNSSRDTDLQKVILTVE